MVYSPRRNSRICAIRSKLIPPVPENLAIMPLNSSVVASASTLGPAMLNTVLPAAKSITATRAILYLPI